MLVALSDDPTDENGITLLAKALLEHFEKQPKLVDQLRAVFGDDSAVQEVIAADDATIRKVRQNMHQHATRQTVKATGRARISDMTQTAGVPRRPRR